MLLGLSTDFFPGLLCNDCFFFEAARLRDDKAFDIDNVTGLDVFGEVDISRTKLPLTDFDRNDDESVVVSGDWITGDRKVEGLARPG